MFKRSQRLTGCKTEIPLKTANQPVMARYHSELLKIPPRSPDLILLRTFSTLYLGSWKDAIDH